MASNGGRRVGMLARRIRSSMSESLGAERQQQLYPIAASQIRDAPSASVSGTAPSVFQPQGRRDFGIELKGTGAAAAWRKFDALPQKARGLVVRKASTAPPSAEALPKQGGVDGEGQQQQQQGKKDTKEAKAADEREEEEEVVDEKILTLRAALSHVPKLGWSEAAIVAGAKDVGLSPAFAGVFPGKEAALVEFFMDECTQALVEELESREEELSKLVVQDRVATIVWTRLQMQVPYLPKWAQALSIQANPVNVPTTVKQRALLMDEIWHAAGDRSTDVDWYTKRAILAGLYSTTELYMLTDISPGFKDTQSFLERRISDALDCRKTAQEAGQLAQAIGAGLQKTVDSLFNRNRPPSGSGFGF